MILRRLCARYVTGLEPKMAKNANDAMGKDGLAGMKLELKKPKWCLHWVCFVARLRCLMGFHTPKVPWKFDLEKDGDDLVGLTITEACFCGKSVEKTTKAIVLINEGASLDDMIEESEYLH